MTSLVEIFQIKRIVYNLINCISLIMISANLKFEQENNAFINQDIINTISDTRYAVFKNNKTIIQISQR